MNSQNYFNIKDTPYVGKLTRDLLANKWVGIENPILQSYEQLSEKAKSREFTTEQRAILVSVLHNQYKLDGIDLPSNSKVYQNIESLGQENHFTITTGQQIHLFLGPLFFIYKIESLLRHVQNFNDLFKETQVIPVFWMASEDHDFEEINYVKLYGENYRWETQSGNAVGRIFCEGINELIDVLENRADKNESNKNFFALLRKHYTENKTLSAATRGLLHELFENRGLVILNPDDHQLKEMFMPIALSELSNQVAFSEYNSTLKKLKTEGYNSRVNAQEINYFWLDAKQRTKLRIENKDILIGNTGEKINLKEIEENSSKLSPNVITRPLYQESVLPNIAYVGGNAEIEYWTPLKSTFEKLNLAFPALILRDSRILLSSKNSKIINESGLNWFDLFKTESEIIDILNHKKSNFETIFNHIFQNYNLLKSELEQSKLMLANGFKDLKEIEKLTHKLSNTITNEELNSKKNAESIQRILKIKQKFFEQKQERDEFSINYASQISSFFMHNTDYMSLIFLDEMLIVS